MTNFVCTTSRRGSYGRLLACLLLLIACGASIPVVADFKNTLGLDTVMVGFGLEDVPGKIQRAGDCLRSFRSIFWRIH